MNPIMMNIIDFVKEFDFIKGRRLRSQGGSNICSELEIFNEGGGARGRANILPPG